VRIEGVQASSELEATGQGIPADRIERDWIRPPAKPHSAPHEINVGLPQSAHLSQGSAMEEREQTEKAFMWTCLETITPATKEGTLPRWCEDLAAESRARSQRQANRRVGQHQPIGTGSRKEGAQHGECAIAATRSMTQEHLYVKAGHGRPAHNAASEEEATEIAHRGEMNFDGLVGEGQGSCKAGTFARPE
jgi:hypothetical protein